MKAIDEIPSVKRCTKCKEEKPINLFGKNIQQKWGLHIYCKECANSATRERSKDPLFRAKKVERERRRKSLPGAKERREEYLRKYYSDPSKIEKRKQYLRDYVKRPEVSIRLQKRSSSSKTREYFKRYRCTVEYRKKQRAYESERLKSNPMYSLKRRLRMRLSSFVRKSKINKSKTEILLGCSYSDFILHIEKQFKDGMSWSNRHLWHLDHITPLASAKTPKELEFLFHYSNIQPMWALDNIKKGSKIL